MLTADHLRLRAKGEELVLDASGGVSGKRGIELATEMCAAFVSAEGESLGHVLEQFADVLVAPREEKLKAGFIKLLLDASTQVEVDSDALARWRSEVFAASAAARRAGNFARESVLTACPQPAATAGIGLFGDLEMRKRMQTCARPAPADLYAEYMHQAILAPLVKAESVRVRVASPPPALLRRLLGKLKFHRLMFLAEETESGVDLTLDGPMSLFGASTKYGMALTLAIRSLPRNIAWSLTARVRHGARRGLIYRAEPGYIKVRGASAHAEDPTAPRTDIAELMAAIAKQPGYRVNDGAVLLDAGRAGLLIPDFEIAHGEQRCHVEVLGYWSREAVWQRIEATARGLAAPIVFCASERLRVSPEALPDGQGARLYVFKGTPKAAALLKCVHAAWDELPPRSPEPAVAGAPPRMPRRAKTPAKA